MKFKFIILYTLLILGNQVSVAQNKSAIDSLLQILETPVHDTTKVNIYAILSDILQRSLPDSATAYAERGLELAKKINYRIGEANLCKNLGNINWSLGELDKAFEAFNKALELYNKQSELTKNSQLVSCKIGIAYCYNGLGIVWFLRGNYNKALEYFQLSLYSHEQVNYKPGIAKGYNNIGMVHLNQDNFDRAIEYFQKSLDIYSDLGNSRDMGGCLNNIAIVFKKQEKYNEALVYYNKSLEILVDQDDIKGIGLCYNNIGMLYEKLNNFFVALNYYKKSLDIKISMGDKQGISSSYSNLASINNKIAEKEIYETKKIEKYKQAIEFAKNGIDVAHGLGLLQQEMDNYDHLSDSYEGLKQFEESLKYYKLKTNLKDSLFNKEKNKQIEEAEAKYQTAHKQQEIEKQRTELEKQKILRNFLILFSILIILLVILLYSRFILKQKTNKILEEKNNELQKLSIVASETDNAVTICDAEGNFEWVNEALYRLFGYTLEDRKKLHGNNVVEASTNQDIKEIIDNVKKTKKSIVYQSTILTAKNEKRILQTTLTPFLDENGELQKLIFIDADITELKNAEQQILQKNEEILVQNEEMMAQNEELEKHRNNLEKLVIERTADLEKAKIKAEESDKLKSAFLANMSHEIRTPMNAIVGFSSLLNDPSISESEKKEINNQVINNSYTLLKLIEDIIDIAKIETGQLVLDIRECSLTELLNDLLIVIKEDMSRQNKENIELVCKINIETGEKIFTDPARLKQLLTKLFENAIKFTETGQIEFGCHKEILQDVQYLRFYVKDTGIGISEEVKKYIFQRFGKAENDKKKLYRGTGLGLTISKNIVHLMGGKIWFESEKEIGSVFYFDLPIINK